VRIATILALLATASYSVPASEPSQTRLKEREKVVRYTEALEVDPLNENSAEMRQWLIQWLQATPDFNVKVCNVLGPIPGDSKVPHGPELLAQQMFGNVASQIKIPDRKDDLSLQLAGVESALKSYSAFLAKDSKVRIPYFDDLLAKQHDGSLRDFMAPVVKKGCAGR
jgi:hypothetical protein